MAACRAVVAVDDGDARLDGRHPVLARHHHNARHGLPDGIVANLVSIRPELPVCRHVHHHDARVQLLQHVIPEPHLLDGARPEVLHQHVRHLDQLPQNLLGLVATQVDGKALLAAVVLGPVGALPVGIRPVIARLLPLQPLHLDNLSPQAGQHLGAPRPRLMPPQVQNSNPLQRSLHFRHSGRLLDIIWWPEGLNSAGNCKTAAQPWQPGDG